MLQLFKSSNAIEIRNGQFLHGTATYTKIRKAKNVGDGMAKKYTKKINVHT